MSAPAKTLSSSVASKFTFEIIASTDAIGGGGLRMHYAKEILTVDPIAEIEDDCLVVIQFQGCSPHLARVRRTGKDLDGRFVKPGSDQEVLRDHVGITWDKSFLGNSVHIIGRVVGPPREFPREARS